MPTENHDLPIDFGEGSYVEKFQTLIEELDRKVLLAGTLEDQPPIEAVPTGVWYLDHEGEENDDADAVLYVARPDEWVIPDLPIATDLSTVPQTDDHFTVTATWSGADEGSEWDADITGDATTAREVEHAAQAAFAAVIDGLTADDFASDSVATTVSGTFTYSAPQTFEDGLTCEGGVLGLPGYDA